MKSKLGKSCRIVCALVILVLFGLTAYTECTCNTDACNVDGVVNISDPIVQYLKTVDNGLVYTPIDVNSLRVQGAIKANNSQFNYIVNSSSNIQIERNNLAISISSIIGIITCMLGVILMLWILF